MTIGRIWDLCHSVAGLCCTKDCRVSYSICSRRISGYTRFEDYSPIPPPGQPDPCPSPAPLMRDPCVRGSGRRTSRRPATFGHSALPIGIVGACFDNTPQQCRLLAHYKEGLANRQCNLLRFSFHKCNVNCPQVACCSISLRMRGSDGGEPFLTIGVTRVRATRSETWLARTSGKNRWMRVR